MTNQMIGVMRYRHPDAYAYLKGSPDYPEIQGTVRFYEYLEGALVCAEVAGLPMKQRTEERCSGDFFGFHLHEGGTCSGNEQDPFADAGMHYNPRQCEHPGHAGDFPVLLGNRGYAWMAFYTDRFRPAEILGRTVVIHREADDFRSQPAGAAGTKIACGVVQS